MFPSDPKPHPIAHRLVNTCKALQTITGQEYEAVAKVKLDVERARMTMEDFRQGSGPASKIIDNQSWRMREDILARYLFANICRLTDGTIACSRCYRG